jgi:hypothetical protein
LENSDDTEDFFFYLKKFHPTILSQTIQCPRSNDRAIPQKRCDERSSCIWNYEGGCLVKPEIETAIKTTWEDYKKKRLTFIHKTILPRNRKLFEPEMYDHLDTGIRRSFF